MTKTNFLLILLTLILQPCYSLLAMEKLDTITLTVQTTGAKANTGQVILSLFNSSEHYLKAPYVDQKVPVDNFGKSDFTIDKLAPGTYAISIIYDENNNGKLDTNFLGIPTELTGFSNGAKSNFGPPSFSEAAIQINRSRTIVIDF